MLGTVRVALGDVFGVFAHAARLLARHWPVVLAILFAGEAARYGALWAAVELSALNNTMGVLVLTFAPLAAVSALIAAMYTLRHSLPSLSATSVSGESPGGVLPVVGNVLVPFLAIYASYGYLDEDVFRFVNTAVTDEIFDVDVLLGTGTIDPDRTALATGSMAMVAVAVALVLRFGLGILGRYRRVPGLVWVAAFVEALWLITVARMLSSQVDSVTDWLQDHAADWLLGLIDSANTLIVIPLAWLTVGAVVYAPQANEPDQHVGVHRAVPDGRLATRLPRPVQRAGRELMSSVAERVGEISLSLRRLAVAGLMPMLLFIVTFVAAQRLEHALNLAWREFLGPLPLNTWLAFAPHTSMVSHAIGTTVMVCLLGAAIDRVLTRGLPGGDSGDDHGSGDGGGPDDGVSAYGRPLLTTGSAPTTPGTPGSGAAPTSAGPPRSPRHRVPPPPG